MDEDGGVPCGDEEGQPWMHRKTPQLPFPMALVVMLGSSGSGVYVCAGMG